VRQKVSWRRILNETQDVPEFLFVVSSLHHRGKRLSEYGIVLQWRRRWNFFKSKAVSLKVHRNTETVILGFSCFPCGILERQELFHRNNFAQKTTYAYLSLSMGCWNVQENLESDLFWADDGRFCGDSPPFCILAPRIQTCQLFYCTKELHFLRRIF